MEEMTPEEKKAERYRKAVETTKLRYGADYYSKNGSKGGKNTTSRPFKNRELAVKAAYASIKVRQAKAEKKAVDK